MNQYTVLLVDDEEEVFQVIMKNSIGRAWDFPLQAMPEMVWRLWKWRRNCSRMWS